MFETKHVSTAPELTQDVKTRLFVVVAAGDARKVRERAHVHSSAGRTGHDVAVYFDGAATYWFDGIEDHPGPAVEAYEQAKERGLIAGVCDHCATFKGVADAAEREGLEIEGTEHEPDVAALVEKGCEIHTV